MPTINARIMTIRSLRPAALLGATLALSALVVSGQDAKQNQTTKRVANALAAETTKSMSGPVFSEYRGVRIGMGADEARQKLGKPKEKSSVQDFYVFSDTETAQVFYDGAQKVFAVSVDYSGKNSDAPPPEAVLGQRIEAKADGSMYQLQKYPEAGYWVSYNRTAGNSPLVTVTMQKMATAK